MSLNGLSVTSTSNTVTNVLDGVSLTLLSTTSSSATVSVSRDTAAITGLVDDFVSAYNTYVGSQKSLTKYDATTGESGFLQGDAMARTMISQIRALISDEIAGLTGNISVLSDLGISVETDGSLKTNATTLDTAVRTNFDSVQKFFVGETVNGAAVSGFAGQIDTLLDSFLDSDGLILAKLSSLDDKLKAVEEDRLLYNQRMEALEARYLRQFNAMDALVGQLTSTGDMLQSQLDALPGYQNLRQSGNR
jgi:flagellar hook-associated protein 2